MLTSERGFTLIEVMIALAIFAVMVGAIALANTQSLTASRLIREQTEARWVNQNVLTQLRMSDLPEPGTREREVSFNGRDWDVEITVTAVDMELLGPLLRRVELRAIPDGEDNSADVLIAVLGEE